MALVHTRAFDPRVIDESPWFWPLRGPWAALRTQSQFPSADALSALYAALSVADSERAPLRFVPAPKEKPKRRGIVVLSALYEGRVTERGEVPQRPDDWHDLFNALAFVVFPRAKAALHRRQYGVLRTRVGPTDTRLPGARTREQDALSLFDEGGVVVVADARVAASIDTNADDCSPDIARHCAAGDALLVPFGHALFEHAVAGLPFPLAMPQVVVASPPWQNRDELLRSVDRALADVLENPAYFREPARSKGLALGSFPCVAPDATRD